MLNLPEQFLFVVLLIISLYYAAIGFIEVINAIYESVQTGREVALRYRPRLSPLGKPKG